MPWEIATIDANAPSYPAKLSSGLMTVMPDRIWCIGSPAILEQRLIGFFWSAKCPGEVILRTYDAARALRDSGVPVIGGFHSPMEKECLDLLLRGKQPIVNCPARGIQRMRIPAAWRPATEGERLLIVSPFEEKYRRATVDLAEQRNHFVASLATDALVAHAGQGTKTDRLCCEMLDAGKSVRVFDVPDNAHLVAKGAVAIRVGQLHTLAEG